VYRNDGALMLKIRASRSTRGTYGKLRYEAPMSECEHASNDGISRHRDSHGLCSFSRLAQECLQNENQCYTSLTSVGHPGVEGRQWSGSNKSNHHVRAASLHFSAHFRPAPWPSCAVCCSYIDLQWDTGNRMSCCSIIKLDMVFTNYESDRGEHQL
jgi:hypothetical protein